MRRGYNRAFSVSVRIAYGNYWRWDMRYLRKKPIKIDALRAEKEKAEIRKHGFSAYQSTPLFSQRTLKNFVRQHSLFRRVKVPFRRWLSVILGASKCQYKGGFPVRTGRVAYFRTRAVWGVRETPLDWCFHATCAWRTRISANISRLAKRPTQLLSQSILKIFAPCAVFLGASKCFHKGGFARGTGRVAYLTYVSGLGRA